MLGVSVYTASSTQFVDWETGAPLRFGDLQIAMPVEIRIPFAAEGFPIVTSAELSVEIEPEPEPEDEEENEDPPAPPPAFCS